MRQTWDCEMIAFTTSLFVSNRARSDPSTWLRRSSRYRREGEVMVDLSSGTWASTTYFTIPMVERVIQGNDARCFGRHVVVLPHHHPDRGGHHGRWSVHYLSILATNFSSLTMSEANFRIPSAVFSVAIAF